MVENLPCNAGSEGFISGHGTKIPQCCGQLNPCVATTEACVLWAPQAITRESVHRNERST